jgi:phosphoribosylanthranilate isomerase
MVHLKVCCIASIEEAQIAIAHGASALGLVSRMPSGPGVIDDDTIASIARAVPPPTATFLLTSETTSEAIARQMHASGATAAQIVDHVGVTVLRELRGSPFRIVQVIHVEDDRALDVASLAEPYADALLLDSGSPANALLGGTGRTHDWAISAKIVERSKIPVFLAGGLSAANVREAIDRVRPHGIDVCSRLRTNGALDPNKLDAFTRELELSSVPLF